MQGRRKSPPEWLLTSFRLLCEKPTSASASRHSWDCRWTSWPLSCNKNTLRIRPGIRFPHTGLYIRNKTTSYLHEFPLKGADGWMLHGAWRWHHLFSSGVKTQIPVRTAPDFGFGVQLTVLQEARRIPLTHRAHERWLPWSTRMVLTAYLAACPAARSHVDEPTLQAPPLGAVHAAGCANIVQLQRERDSSR